LQCIEKALEKYGGRHFVHHLFAILPPDITRDQHPVRLRRGQSLVPCANRNGQRAFKLGNKLPDLLGGRSVAAVHVARHSNDDLLDILLLKQILQKVHEILGWFCGNILKRRGNHLEFVAHRHTYTDRSMIEGQNAHQDIAPECRMKRNANLTCNCLTENFGAVEALRMKSILAILATVLITAFSVENATAAEDIKKLEGQVEEAMSLLKAKDSSFEKALKKAYGHVIFPNVGKGGFIVGGAGGSGLVYEGDKLIGSATLSQGTIGAQIGGQTFVEVLLFSDKIALSKFKESRFEMSAGVSAVAVSEGVAEKVDYENGMAVIILPKKGLMAEASIGGQKFSYTPLGDKKN